MAWDGYFPWAFCLSLSLDALGHHTLTCKYMMMWSFAVTGFMVPFMGS